MGKSGNMDRLRGREIPLRGMGTGVGGVLVVIVVVMGMGQG